MIGSRRRFAIALIVAVLIGAICAAPAVHENDVGYGSKENGEDPVTVQPHVILLKMQSQDEKDKPERSNQGSALQLNSAFNPVGSTDGNEAGNNFNAGYKIEGSESSNPEPYPTPTMTNSVPQQNSTTENQFDSSAEESHSSTTEHPHNIIGRIYSPQRDKPGRISHAGGVHDYRIENGEDENKRALEEYNYHFVRVEKGLPPTTKRGDRFRAP